MSDNSADKPPLLSTRLQRLIGERESVCVHATFVRAAEEGGWEAGCQAQQVRYLAFDVITPRHAKAEKGPFAPASSPR